MQTKNHCSGSHCSRYKLVKTSPVYTSA